MSRSLRLVTADSFTGQYKNRANFVDGILTRLKLAARADGWIGCQLFDADWIKAEGQPDMAVIAIAPGLGDVSVADVRTFLAERKKRERKAA